jgi:predicted nucleic acid-binding protein
LAWFSSIRLLGYIIFGIAVTQAFAIAGKSCSKREAAWCSMVRLELWHGVGSEADRKMLREYEIWLSDLAITDAVSDEACALASRCRPAGKTAPANDVLIAACARHYQVDVDFTDTHFEFLLTL